MSLSGSLDNTTDVVDTYPCGEVGEGHVVLRIKQRINKEKVYAAFKTFYPINKYDEWWQTQEASRPYRVIVKNLVDGEFYVLDTSYFGFIIKEAKPNSLFNRYLSTKHYKIRYEYYGKEDGLMPGFAQKKEEVADRNSFMNILNIQVITQADLTNEVRILFESLKR